MDKFAGPKGVRYRGVPMVINDYIIMLVLPNLSEVLIAWGIHIFIAT